MSVTPGPGVVHEIVTGGTPVTAINAFPNGGFITNPLSAADQGLATAEPLIVNPVSSAGTIANDTNFALQPGQTWTVIAGQTTATSVNAISSGHKFSVVVW